MNKKPIIDIGSGGNTEKIERPDWKERVAELTPLAFKPDFLNGLIDLPTVLESLVFRKTMDVFEHNTKTGEIIYLKVTVNENDNKSHLDTIILDYDSYNEFVSLQYYEVTDTTTDIEFLGILEYSREHLGDEIRYNYDDDDFYHYTAPTETEV